MFGGYEGRQTWQATAKLDGSTSVVVYRTDGVALPVRTFELDGVRVIRWIPEESMFITWDNRQTFRVFSQEAARTVGSSGRMLRDGR